MADKHLDDRPMRHLVKAMLPVLGRAALSENAWKKGSLAVSKIVCLIKLKGAETERVLEAYYTHSCRT